MLQQSQTPQPTGPVTMTEAPYSWNTIVQDLDSGFVETFTLRAVTAEGFGQRIDALKKSLIERGYKPATRNGHSASAAPASEEATNGAGEQAPVCPYHKSPMVKRQSKNGSGFFWSCPHKIEGTDQWCTYKPPKS